MVREKIFPENWPLYLITPKKEGPMGHGARENLSELAVVFHLTSCSEAGSGRAPY
jgi:hypothetical protein